MMKLEYKKWAKNAALIIGAIILAVITVKWVMFTSGILTGFLESEDGSRVKVQIADRFGFGTLGNITMLAYLVWSAASVVVLFISVSIVVGLFIDPGGMLSCLSGCAIVVAVGAGALLMAVAVLKWAWQVVFG